VAILPFMLYQLAGATLCASIASDHFKAGNDRNANTKGVLDFTPGLTTSRREDWVRTILTESGSSIPLPVRDFKALRDEKRDARRQARHFVALSVLTARALQREVTDTSLKASGAVDRDATRT
jgi:hypothetical protein